MKLSKQFQLYESDHAQFIRELKEKNPEIEKGQREGRALLWDKEPLDIAERERQLESLVKQQPYVYQTQL